MLPLRVELRDEKGGVIRLGPEWPDPLLPHLSALTTLGYLDPNGETVFNRLQMAAVIPELQSLKSRIDSDFQAVIDRVLAIADECADEPHTYLAFVSAERPIRLRSRP